MRQVKKYIRTFFLWLAGIILLAHSVIPHHHHLEFSSADEICHQECNHSNAGDHSVDKKESFKWLTGNNGHEHESCNGCEFNAKTSTLSNLSVDIPDYTELNSQIILFPSELTTVRFERTNQYSHLYCKTVTLRGPPVLG